MSDTQFLILCAFEHDYSEATGAKPNQTWQEVATVNARSKEQALRSVGGNAGVYVAVPTRSWQPVRLEIETVQRTRLSAATPATKDEDPS